MPIAKTNHSWGEVVVLLVSASLAGCCHYPKSHVTALGKGNKPLASVTIVAYGDTRTGPWGLGDNRAQAIHGEVVTDILQHDQPIDAVIFTGDAVMSTFYLWERAYWQCFLCQSNRFRSAGIPFYPSLGNHEVLSPAVPLIKSNISIQQSEGPKAATEQQLAEAYDQGEEPTPTPPKEVQTVMGVRQGTDSRLLKRIEEGVDKGNPDSATQFGQFERDVQQNFYSEPIDKRCELDANTFQKAYLSRAKYRYLRSLVFRDGAYHSYYSQVLQKGALSITLIALDTNCLDSPEQQKFFSKAVHDSHGPIIVFGHHPPVDYKSPEGWPWDKVPGWGKTDSDPMKSYLTGPEASRIALWVFGHVHDYQRRAQITKDKGIVAPVMLIAGGGGAPLDASAAPFQWQPPTWPAFIQKSAYSQVRIVITGTGITVETRGKTQKTGDFDVIDSFSIPLQPPPVS
jgi:hypothetical protein